MRHEQQQDLESTSTQEATTSTDIEQNLQEVEEKVSFKQKTERITAWSDFIKSMTPFIWAVVIIIVLIPLLGKALITGSSPGKLADSGQNPSQEVSIVVPQIPKDIDQALVTALKNAHSQAESFASEQLDNWVDELMTRVDESFFDWYFNYFNQKKMELSAPFTWLYSAVTHWTNKNKPSPGQAVAEKLTEDFQVEFAKRVLRPKVAQLEFEKITTDSINLYVTELSKNISNIQSSYKIPQGDWERYLGDIAVTINDMEGNISHLSLKVLSGGSTYLLAKAMIPTVTKVGSKIAVSFAGKAGAKMAAKTGGVVAGKIGAQLLDPIVGIGIIIWDVWDYNHTVAVEKPRLREAIYDYLKEVKFSLLENPENGIMVAINQVENGILKSIKSSPQ
ncbi:hypothetical protein [Brasilonema bromeliae]|uniref:Uncharacterized protein n=1 Tax=Brasilonema bromeliae SPC951 TaxID=385972 RepID=A0ABX1P2I6_9CYAN|nr:hypothetical protein [Brasilonema bromeliae]NMG18549.1 hypothetical protein [Brasilonema bromeliae SPC951]